MEKAHETSELDFTLRHIYRVDIKEGAKNPFSKSPFDIDAWDLSRLRPMFEASSYLFPALVASKEQIAVDFLHANKRARDSRILVFKYSTDGFVTVVLEASLRGSLADIIGAMEDAYYARLRVADVGFDAYLGRVMDELNAPLNGFELSKLTRSYHQVLFTDNELVSGGIDTDVVQRLIYRADLPARDEFSAIEYPKEMNRRPGSLAAVGPFVTVLSRQQDYMVNAVTFSAIMLVSVRQRLKDIRDSVYRAMEEMKSHSGDKDVDKIQASIKRLMRYRYELTAYVDSYRILGLYVSAMRLENYHDVLWSQLGLDERLDVTTRLLETAKEYVELDFMRQSELKAKHDEINKSSWSIIVALLSVLTIPPSLIFAFFGSDVVEIGSNPSLFDFSSFIGLYIFVLASVVFSLLSGFFYKVVAKRSFRKSGRVDL